ncbi:AMP-binding protein, partial [Roseospira navarrensis]
MLTCADILTFAAARDPGAPALVDGPRAWTYAETLAAARGLAAGLRRMGLTPGDRVLTVLQNRAEAALVHWAAYLADLVVTPVNWRVNAAELDYFLTDSGAALLVFEPATAEAVRGSARAAVLPRIGMDGAAGADLDIEALEALAPDPAPTRPSAASLSVLLYTSGTTGPGKGVPRSHRAERAAALAHVAQNALRPGDRTLGVMPLYHTMGVRLLLSMALVNGLFVCQRRFDAAEALALIARHRITTLYLVPTLYHDLVSHPDFEGADVSGLRALGFAGAPMTDGLLRRLTETIRPALFVNHYGSSEI